MHFDSAGTCLIVRQYLERSRNILRSDLGEKIQELLSHDVETNKKLNQSASETAPDAAPTTATPDDVDNKDRRTAKDANTVTV